MIDFDQELDFIRRVDRDHPGGEFNFSAATFASYCEVQILQAERAGRRDVADAIVRYLRTGR